MAQEAAQNPHRGQGQVLRQALQHCRQHPWHMRRRDARQQACTASPCVAVQYTVPDTLFGDTSLPRSIREQRIARRKAGRREEPPVRAVTARDGKP